jgi:hypothetical protein
MTYRNLGTAFLVIAFLAASRVFAFAADCASCDRTLADCRSPLQAKYVSCMNSGSQSCGSKCGADCKGDQKCTYSCVKTCQGGSSSCQGTYSSASAQCMNAYNSCKKGCTTPR